MKKVLLGCGVLVLILGIGGAIGSYYYLWRPAKSFIVDVAKLQEIPQLNQQVKNTATFTPPPENLLTSQAVDRFVRTQQSIRNTLGPRAEALSAKYERIERSLAGRTPSWPQLVDAYKDLADLILQAKRAQIEALNQNNFSLAEYDWTRQRIYEAADAPLAMNLEKFITAVAEGKKPEDVIKNEAGAVPTVPQKNRELIAPHRQEIVDRIALAAFGL